MSETRWATNRLSLSTSLGSFRRSTSVSLRLPEPLHPLYVASPTFMGRRPSAVPLAPVRRSH